MRWIEIENPVGAKIPKWKRSAAMSDTGVVFVPGAIAGDEETVILCALYDGISPVLHLKHLYVPSAWLAREYPKIKETCKNIESKVKDLGNTFGENNG